MQPFRKQTSFVQLEVKMSVKKIISFQEMKTFNTVYGLAGFYAGHHASMPRQVYHWLSDSLITCTLLATVYQLLTCPSKQKESFSVSLVVGIAYSLALYYSLCFRLQYQKIVEMKTILEDVAVSLAEVISKRAVIESTQYDIRFSKVYVASGIFTAFTSAILFSIQPLLRSLGIFGKDGQKVLQIDTWCPYDCHAPIAFEITVVVQFVTVFWVAVRFFANDSFYMFAIKLNIQYFKLLTSLGKNVLSHDLNQQLLVVTEQGNKTFLRKRGTLKVFQPIIDENEEICDVFSYSLNNLLEFDERSNKLAYDKLNVFIKQHQIILRCAKHTCQVYGPVMMIYVLSLIGFLSVGAFGVINTNGFEGVQSAAVVLFSIVNLLCMFFMSEAGDQLALQSGDVAASLVHGPWYKCSRQFRSSLVLVVQRVNTRVQASVVGVPSMPLSCITFTWVIKTLVSLYLFMVEVQEVKKS